MVLTPPVMAGLVGRLHETLSSYIQNFGAPQPLPKPPPNQPKPSIQDIYEQFKLPEEMYSGSYANSFLIAFGPAEFCFDFITGFFPTASVSTRTTCQPSRSRECSIRWRWRCSNTTSPPPATGRPAAATTSASSAAAAATVNVYGHFDAKMRIPADDERTSEPRPLAGLLSYRQYIVVFGYVLGGWSILQFMLTFVVSRPTFWSAVRGFQHFSMMNLVAMALSIISPLLLVIGCWGLQHHRRSARTVLLTYSALWIAGMIGTRIIVFVDMLIWLSSGSILARLSVAAGMLDSTIYGSVFQSWSFCS